MIDEVDGITIAAFRATYEQALRPLVIRGAVRHWPAVGKWDLRYLRNAIAPKSIRLKSNQSGCTEYTFPDHIDALRAHLHPPRADLYAPRAGRARNPLPPYLTNANIHRHFPELAADLEPYCEYALPDLSASPLLPRDFMYDRYGVELLVGIEGHRFGCLHTDLGYIHAFLAQIHGEKECILFAPEDTRNVYPDPDSPLTSAIDDIWAWDTARFPRLARATPYRLTLAPGDLLFIPSGWWHTTRMHTTSIGVTFNSVRPSNWQAFSKEAIRLMAVNKPLKARFASVYLKLMKYPIFWTASAVAPDAPQSKILAANSVGRPQSRYAT